MRNPNKTIKLPLIVQVRPLRIKNDPKRIKKLCQASPENNFQMRSIKNKRNEAKIKFTGCINKKHKIKKYKIENIK